MIWVIPGFKICILDSSSIYYLVVAKMPRCTMKEKEKEIFSGAHYPVFHEKEYQLKWIVELHLNEPESIH